VCFAAQAVLLFDLLLCAEPCYAAPCYVSACRSLYLVPLPGPLPASWGDLCCVEEIDVQNNYMTGVLPETWGKLTTLKSL
jgi:hypothetical protein